MLQLLATEAWRNIPEEYVLIMETDHLFMRPPANKATPDSPSAFKFYYMNAKDPKLAPIIKNYWSGPLDDVDPVGPSPAIMTKRTLEKLAPAWCAPRGGAARAPRGTRRRGSPLRLRTDRPLPPNPSSLHS